TQGNRIRCYFFFQAEDGIRDLIVTGVQTCALPIFSIAYIAAARGLLVRQPAQAEDEEGAGGDVGDADELGGHRAGAGAGRGGRRSEERRVGKECGCRWTQGR